MNHLRPAARRTRTQPVFWIAGLALVAAGCSGAQFASGGAGSGGTEAGTGTGGSGAKPGSGGSGATPGSGGTGASPGTGGTDAGGSSDANPGTGGTGAGGGAPDGGALEASTGCGVCPQATPLCDPNTQQCVQCLSHTDCQDPAAPVCFNGSCTCPGGAVCNTKCVDLNNDPNNCGGCGQPCSTGQACVNGTCACLPGLTNCNGNCVDLKSDPSHCGSCSSACSSGQACTANGCHSFCGSGLTKCQQNGGYACVDTNNDPLNCGDCGNTCNADELCISGSCRRYGPAVGCSSCPCLVCAAIIDSSRCCATSGAPICVSGSSCPPSP